MGKIITVKQHAFAAAYYTLGSKTLGNGVKSARVARYKGNDRTLENVASTNIRKPIIIAEKRRIQAEANRRLDMSREKQHAKLDQALAIAIESKSPAAMVSAIREQNEMLGYHRDKAPNTERVAAMKGRVSDEQRRILTECADILLRKQVASTVVPIESHELSSGCVKPKSCVPTATSLDTRLHEPASSEDVESSPNKKNALFPEGGGKEEGGEGA